MSEEKPLVNAIRPKFVQLMDPQFVEIYTKFQAPRIRADQVSIEEYRNNTHLYTFPITPGPKPATASAQQHQVQVQSPPGQITVQVFTPTENSIVSGGLKTSAGLPAHVNFHGGGWVIGSLRSDESWCRQACQGAGIVVIDVDYRLAPEFPFPAQVWDAWAALEWVHRDSTANEFDIDRTRVSIGGLSAGGHLAAVLAIMARDHLAMPPLRLQLLTVPSVDVRSIPTEGGFDPTAEPYYESYQTCEHAPCLPLQRMRWFCGHWLGKGPARIEAANSWMASPILAASHKNLAPASIHCAEFDLLRSEAEAYHEKLTMAGTPSTLKIYGGVAHPFGRWDGGLDKGKEYVQDTIRALRAAHQ